MTGFQMWQLRPRQGGDLSNVVQLPNSPSPPRRRRPGPQGASWDRETGGASCSPADCCSAEGLRAHGQNLLLSCSLPLAVHFGRSG